jgi:AcrR family transcriptional regulator
MARPQGESFTSDKILKKIIKALNRHSFLDLTLAQVASLLNIKSPSLYNHFDGLEDLKSQIALIALNQFSDCLEASLQQGDCRGKLSAFMTSYREFALTKPFLFEAAQFGIQAKNKEVLQKAHSIAQMTEKALDAYQIPKAKQAHALRVIRSLLNGFIQIEQNRGFQRSEDPSQSFREMIEFAVTGLSSMRKT